MRWRVLGFAQSPSLLPYRSCPLPVALKSSGSGGKLGVKKERTRFHLHKSSAKMWGSNSRLGPPQAVTTDGGQGGQYNKSLHRFGIDESAGGGLRVEAA